MGSPEELRKARAAWDRIEALGGYGVWDKTMVVVSLAGAGITDEDLSLFRDFPYVQILDLSHTAVSDDGLIHLAGLPSLTDLIAIDTQISGPALAGFQRDHPAVKVTTEPPPKGSINPFTSELM
jgi:hypothetical protein